MGSGGIGFTIGSSKTTHDLREKGTTQSESFSTVGSTAGNVSITAGQQAHIGGADIIAQKILLFAATAYLLNRVMTNAHVMRSLSRKPAD